MGEELPGVVLEGAEGLEGGGEVAELDYGSVEAVDEVRHEDPHSPVGRVRGDAEQRDPAADPTNETDDVHGHVTRPGTASGGMVPSRRVLDRIQEIAPSSEESEDMAGKGIDSARIKEEARSVDTRHRAVLDAVVLRIHQLVVKAEAARPDSDHS